ncbi:MAG: T9SS type A sorting domain-containing protein [Bacteroidia bacterium]|nr:T9SS type A sorting domain-containing protein [Bacteroidia bacterium]
MVNQYTEVLTIDNVNSTVTVADPSSFALNDRVMIIQMKGATIDESNSFTFGDVNPINGAGLFEMASVCGVNGNKIGFQYELVNTYSTDSDARIQLIKVPQYVNQTVTGTLTAPAWNGATGGVVALELTGTLTLNANIDVSNLGFRGGTHLQGATCTVIANAPNYFYPYSGVSGIDTEGGMKGEGVAEYISGKEYGKGAQANGGGGGNNHNNGGGGGANSNFGGTGGYRSAIFCSNFDYGSSGEGLGFYGYGNGGNNNIFMGGGGGSGHDNNGDGNDGGDGGGIIIIKADAIEGNGFAIRANGQSPAAVLGDGASGGGGGGAILLSTNGYGSTALTVQANGGNGGNTTLAGNCPGPGGGGGGGVVWVGTVPGGLVSVTVTGGANGMATGCSSNQAATSGLDGTYTTGAVIPEEVTTTSPCVLSPEVVLEGEWTPEQNVRLNWTTEGIRNQTTISLERSADGVDFVALEDWVYDVFSPVSSSKDYFPEGSSAIYRLKLRDPSGTIRYSNQIEIHLPGSKSLQLSVFPNPLPAGTFLKLKVYLPETQNIDLMVMDVLGKPVYRENTRLPEGVSWLVIDAARFAAGNYVVRINGVSGSAGQSFWKTN